MYQKYSELRDARGLTDYQVAQQTGIPQSSIYDWKQRAEKNAGALISVSALSKIASLFDVSIEAFLQTEGK